MNYKHESVSNFLQAPGNRLVLLPDSAVAGRALAFPHLSAGGTHFPPELAAGVAAPPRSAEGLDSSFFLPPNMKFNGVGQRVGGDERTLMVSRRRRCHSWFREYDVETLVESFFSKLTNVIGNF